MKYLLKPIFIATFTIIGFAIAENCKADDEWDWCDEREWEKEIEEERPRDIDVKREFDCHMRGGSWDRITKTCKEKSRG